VTFFETTKFFRHFFQFYAKKEYIFPFSVIFAVEITDNYV